MSFHRHTHNYTHTHTYTHTTSQKQWYICFCSDDVGDRQCIEHNKAYQLQLKCLAPPRELTVGGVYSTALLVSNEADLTQQFCVRSLAQKVTNALLWLAESIIRECSHWSRWEEPLPAHLCTLRLIHTRIVYEQNPRQVRRCSVTKGIESTIIFCPITSYYFARYPVYTLDSTGRFELEWGCGESGLVEW